MDNTRQSKISRLIQKELSEIFRKQTQAMPGILVSVTSVRVSADLSIARANLSIFPSERAEEILANIRSQAVQVRYDLGQRVRMQLRRIPELYFHLDDSLDYIERIDELLKK
ncbi:MAG: 30S ribosome-binding factor RbfA [Porphyromonas sp.]|nr:30S ribosome-binding factor RbfA [Porphyromonas sp.]